MQITILGTGVVGRTLASKLIAEGHSVTIGTRDPALKRRSKETFGERAITFEQWLDEHPELELLPFSECVRNADVVFNCTPGLMTLTILTGIPERDFTDVVVVDVSNPLDFSKGMPPSLNPVNTDSLGEQIQHYLPKAFVVKALNTVNYRVMVDPAILGDKHQLFVCGDHPEAKKKLASLLQEFGWLESQILDLGDLTHARGMEMMLPLWVGVWQVLGTTRFNFGVTSVDS